MGKKLSLLTRLKIGVLFYATLSVIAYGFYYEYWGKHVYIVTAYCDCPICINVSKYRDGKFADGKKVHWGGIAADPKVKFGSKVELMPTWPQDWYAVHTILDDRKHFVVEDRGGKIKGRHIDLFIPDSMGGHQTAKRWGRRRMRIKINGELAE